MEEILLMFSRQGMHAIECVCTQYFSVHQHAHVVCEPLSGELPVGLEDGAHLLRAGHGCHAVCVRGYRSD
jgi:hypothetical protein